MTRIDDTHVGLRHTFFFWYCSFFEDPSRQHYSTQWTSRTGYIILYPAGCPIPSPRVIALHQRSRIYRYCPLFGHTCTVFEDNNQSCIEYPVRNTSLFAYITLAPTSWISKTITIQQISTRDQLADIFSKRLLDHRSLSYTRSFHGMASLFVRE